MFININMIKDIWISSHGCSFSTLNDIETEYKVNQPVEKFVHAVESAALNNPFDSIRKYNVWTKDGKTE